MKKTNVLYLDHSNDFSGGQVSLVALLSLLSRSQYNPLVGLDTNALLLKQELERLSIPYVEFPFHSLRFYKFLALVRLGASLKKTVKRRDIHLVHANTFMTGLLVSFFKMIIKRPFIFRARLAIEHHGHGIVDRIIYRSSDLILANSFYVKKTFEDRFGKSKKIFAVYNPLDLKDEFTYEQTMPPNEEFKFGIIGRIETIKRHTDLVDAVEILSKKGLHFKVFVIGAASKGDRGRYYQLVHSRIREKGLENYFVWTGFVPKPMQIARTLHACLSCTVGEALSRSIFECQFHKTLVLASRSGGNEELIRDGDTGFFFEPANINSLAEKMEFLIRNYHRLDIADIKEKAYRQTTALFAVQSTVRKEEQLYQTLVH
jgi:glycosyltransferase involved in cell wall biosynthesis